MEDYKLSVKEMKQKKEYKLIDIHRIKRGFVISICPFIFSIITLKIYFLGINLKFSIGKLKKEK